MASHLPSGNEEEAISAFPANRGPCARRLGSTARSLAGLHSAAVGAGRVIHLNTKMVWHAT